MSALRHLTPVYKMRTGSSRSSPPPFFCIFRNFDTCFCRLSYLLDLIKINGPFTNLQLRRQDLPLGENSLQPSPAWHRGGDKIYGGVRFGFKIGHAESHTEAGTGASCPQTPR